jgi:hypothetical protein
MGAGAAACIGGVVFGFPAFIGASPVLVGMGVALVPLGKRLHPAEIPELRVRIPLDRETEKTLVDLSRAAARGRDPSPDLVLPDALDWLEAGATAAMTIFGTLVRLGPEHPFVHRSHTELEHAIDFAMLELLRLARALRRFPETGDMVAVEAGLILMRLAQLAHLVERAAIPTLEDGLHGDPLQRAIESLSLESLARSEIG